ncbi:MAG TPA: RIP metalloprotease RseP [Longimicrobium sp.]
MLLNIAAFLVVIGVLVTIHEAGHFFAAKWVGIQVPRFSIGFGPRVIGFTRGETEYVISAIPLGGYVKMAGMEDDEAQSLLEGGDEGVPVDPERTFDSKPLWARTLVISAGVIVNFLFAILVYGALAAAYGERVIRITKVATPEPATAVGPAAEAAKIPFGARVVSVGGKPVSSWGGIRRGIVDAAPGPLPVLLEGGRTVTLVVPEGRTQRMEVARAIEPLIPAVIPEVVAGQAAARAGMKAGDRVVAVNGRAVQGWNDFVRVVRASPGLPLPVEVERGGQRVRMTVTPAAEREDDENGKSITIGRIGARPPEVPTERRSVGVVEAVKTGFTDTWDGTVSILDALRDLITGRTSARNMGGLLTIGQASGQTARMGLDVFLAFLAFFSINLAVLNLLPIPVLDGGHLMFLGIEAVRGRPLSVETRIRLSQVGLLIVVALMLWANGNDVVRWIEGLRG